MLIKKTFYGTKSFNVKIVAKKAATIMHRPSTCAVFESQQDDDSKHSLRLTKEWLRREEIDVLDWPTQSPGLHMNTSVWRWVRE